MTCSCQETARREGALRGADAADRVHRLDSVTRSEHRWSKRGHLGQLRSPEPTSAAHDLSAVTSNQAPARSPDNGPDERVGGPARMGRSAAGVHRRWAGYRLVVVACPERHLVGAPWAVAVSDGSDHAGIGAAVRVASRRHDQFPRARCPLTHRRHARPTLSRQIRGTDCKRGRNSGLRKWL